MSNNYPIKTRAVKVQEAPTMDSAYSVMNGVGIDWLRRVFHLTPKKCEEKMRGARIVGTTTRGTALYDIGEAAERLVKPKLDLREYLKDITVDDMPDHLKESFWNAKLKQQRWEKNAGELWRTEAVVHLFGSVLKDIKDRMRLISTVAENELGLSPKQLHDLNGIVNDIQSQIYEDIMSINSKTPSSVAELNKQYGDEEPDYESPTAMKDDDDDDFEY